MFCKVSELIPCRFLKVFLGTNGLKRKESWTILILTYLRVLKYGYHSSRQLWLWQRRSRWEPQGQRWREPKAYSMIAPWWPGADWRRRNENENNWRGGGRGRAGGRQGLSLSLTRTSSLFEMTSRHVVVVYSAPISHDDLPTSTNPQKYLQSIIMYSMKSNLIVS